MADDIKEIRLIIPLASYRKIMAYVSLVDTEITGFADVEYNQARNAFIMQEVYLIEQEAGGATVHMEEQDVSKFNLEMIKKGVTQLPRIWWHSHADMGAFFSGVDEETLVDLQNDSFIIALVVNKRKEMKAKAYIYQEVKTKALGFNFEKKEFLEIDPLEVVLEFDYERIPEAIKTEVKEKVKERKFVSKLPYTNPYIKDKPGVDLKSLFLPKNKELALQRITQKGLVRRYNADYGDFVYIDPVTEDVWVDYWRVLENDSITPEEELAGILKEYEE